MSATPKEKKPAPALERPKLCPCGSKKRACFGCGEFVCVAPGHAEHRCGGPK